MPATPRSLIPVTLLTGFLGSGKTTLLNRLVRQPAMDRTLVIINEFGEIGLDHQLFSAADETEVVALDSGCLCCTIRGDLARTLRDAPWRYAREGKRQFDRLVIETTGLADPAPILHTLMTDPKIARQYRLDGIVTIVDAVHGGATLDHHTEALKQAAVADRLLLTKADLAPAGGARRLARRRPPLAAGVHHPGHPARVAGERTGGGELKTPRGIDIVSMPEVFSSHACRQPISSKWLTISLSLAAFGYSDQPPTRASRGMPGDSHRLHNLLIESVFFNH